MRPQTWAEQIQRRADPTRLIGMEQDELTQLEAEFSFFMRNLETGAQAACFSGETTVFHDIYCFVSHKLPYRDDKRGYLALDYHATPSEALSKGADDCEGKAVVISTMLAARGYDAVVVMGTEHTWVEVADEEAYVYIAFLGSSDPVIIRDAPLPTPSSVYVRFNAEQAVWTPAPLLVQGALVWAYLFIALASGQILYARRLYARPLGYVSEMVGYFKYLLYMILFIFGVWVGILLFVQLLYRMP